jgi:hypothetical protein
MWDGRQSSTNFKTVRYMQLSDEFYAPVALLFGKSTRFLDTEDEWANEPARTFGRADNSSCLPVIERPSHNLATKPTQLHRCPPLNV